MLYICRKYNDMSTFKLRLKPFDVLMIVICIISIIKFIVNGIRYQDSDYYVYAAMSVAILVLYVKVSDMFN